MRTKLIPTASVPDMRREFLTPFDSIFDKLVGEAFPELTKEFGVGFFERGSYPKVDLIDEDKNIVIEAEIPGLSREDVKIHVKEGVLTISGNKFESTNDERRYIKRELKRSSFKRSFALGDNLDEDKINASFNLGILKITIPKKVQAAPVIKTIEIG